MADPQTKLDIPEELSVTAMLPLWQLDITEVAGRNIETSGREEVNKMLQDGWVLLHVYTLKYREDSIWRERPMAILGKPRKVSSKKSPKK